MGLRGTREMGSGEYYVMRSLMIFSLHLIIFGDQIEKNETGRACSTYGERRGIYRVLAGKLE